MTKNSWLLLHEGTDGASREHSRNVTALGQHNIETRRQIHKIFADRSGMHINKVVEKIKFDTYLSADQAVELNLVDKII